MDTNNNMRSVTTILRGPLSLLIVALLALTVALSASGVPADDNGPAWSAESNVINANFGWAVSGVGDVNNDTFDDVVVTAHQYSNGQDREGIAYLFLGSADGLSATPSWSYESDKRWALLGLVADTAGDVNNDGYDDILLAGQGLYVVFHGGPNGPAAMPNWEVETSFFNSFLGKIASHAGDVNNDGYDDVIIGERERVTIFRGSQSGLKLNPAWELILTLPGSNFGGTVSAAGDVNGDGIDDVLVGAHYFGDSHSFEGAATLYYGKDGAFPNTSPDWAIDSNAQQAFFGRPLTDGGDVNGDGYDDIVIGAFPFSGTLVNQGQGYVFLGSATGPSDTPDWSVKGTFEGAFAAYAMSDAGDINGDGFDDLIFGSPYYARGRADVFYGSAAGLTTFPNWSRSTQDATERLGNAVAGVGDVNGDGFNDVVIGAPNKSNGQFSEGAAYLYLGSESGLPGSRNNQDVLLPFLTVSGAAQPVSAAAQPAQLAISNAATDWAFTDVSAEMGLQQNSTQTFGVIWLDVDGDGWQDAIYTNHGSNPTFYANNNGNSFATFTNQSGIDTTLTRYVGELDRHGLSCADYNNDGRPDLFITRGANRTAALGIKIDELLRNDGAQYTLIDPALSQITSTWGRGRSATWVDYDRNGYLDLYVGNDDTDDMLFRNNGNGTFSDRSNALNIGRTWQNTNQAWADFERDGWPDVILGGQQLRLYRNVGGTLFEESTSLVSLSETGFVRSMGWGDFNGDGYVDLAVGTLSRITIWQQDPDTHQFSRFATVNERLDSLKWADIDNDNDLDLLVMIGGALVVFENEAGSFQAGTIIATIQPGLNLSDFDVIDYDNDGDLDVAAAGSGHYLFRNDGPTDNWLRLNLVGSDSNRMGIGAKVTVTLPDSQTIYREHLYGTGTRFATSCAPLHVGVSGATTVTLQVEWPSGQISNVTNVAVNQPLTVVEP